MENMKKNEPHAIDIQTKVNFLPEQSDESGSRFVFSYTITITNLGNQTVKLVSRHWIITDADHQVQEVRGQGVVGEQPVLKPGEGFRYTSGAVIETPVGTMHGTYQMVAEDGRAFDATIPRFILSAPRTLH